MKGFSRASGPLSIASLLQLGSRIVTSDDARRLAKWRLPQIIFDYIDGAAGTEHGAALNLSELARVRLTPRVLVNVDKRSIAKRFFDRDWNAPFGIAPMGMCNLAWPGADRLLAAEAVARGIPHCLSTAASTSLEEMRQAGGENMWFQLYVSGPAEAGLALADRAAAAGYDVLVHTVDVPQVGRRPRDLRNGFSSQFKITPQNFLDFATHPQWSIATLRAGAPALANFVLPNGGSSFDRHASRASADWDFLDRLRERWKGKLVVKGVMAAEDALRIKAAGVDAVYVSNHGARQLDATPAAATALTEIRAAVGPDYPLLFDSGVRSGEDIVKALALGADFVMLGRTLLYAVAGEGALGLASMLNQLTGEIDATLAQIGLRQIQEIGPSALPSASISS